MKRYLMADSGVSYSQFIAGFWRLDEWDMSAQQRLSLMEQYLELGVTTMDHADIYGGFENEALFGEAIALSPEIRSRIELVTKCNIAMMCDAYPKRKTGYYDTSKQYILKSVENSLHNFKTDYLDTLLIHRPDPLMRADEVAEAFIELKESGKVRSFGVSNFTPSQFSLLQSRLPFQLITNQVEVNLLNKGLLHDGTLDQMQELQINPMLWSPLAGGEFFWGEGNKVERVNKQLRAISDELGSVSIDQILYAWLLKLPSAPLPIIGSGNIERITSAVQSADLSLSREQWFSLWEASEGNPVP